MPVIMHPKKVIADYADDRIESGNRAGEVCATGPRSGPRSRKRAANTNQSTPVLLVFAVRFLPVRGGCAGPLSRGSL